MKLKQINEVKESELIEITPEWMSENYDKLNKSLFSGKLMGCKFGVFTTGKGKDGGVLGWFKKNTSNLLYRKSSRRMFKYDAYRNEIWVSKQNFVEMCNPTIEMNGNYRWTEKAALSTLLHEMCHYYCNMNGFVPTQAHGNEFKAIAYEVSSKSDGLFTVERVASAEQMGEMELASDVKARVDARKENRIQKMLPILIYMINGEIRLVNCNCMLLVNSIVNEEKEDRRCKKILLINDPEFKNLLIDNRYRNLMTKYRWWEVQRESWVNDIEKYNYEVIYEK